MGTQIKEEETAKFLGVTFDNSLSYEQHIKEVKEKVKKRINMLRYVASVKKGASPWTMILLYKNMVRSVLEYALPIYYGENRRAREDFGKIQNRGVRIVMGYRITTPINVMHAEAGMMRLQHRVELLVDRYCIRQRGKRRSEVGRTIRRCVAEARNGTSLRKNAIVKAWEKTLEIEDRIFKAEKDKKWEEETGNLNRIITMVEGKMKQRNNGINDTTLANMIREKLGIEGTKWVEIYTDGSKTKEGRTNGIGIVTREGGEWKEEGMGIDKIASIFATEAVAISKAIERADAYHGNTPTIIMTDSERALAKGYPKRGENPWIKKIMKQIRVSNKRRRKRGGVNNKIGMAWIPAHVGIEGNERADRIAKENTGGESGGNVKIPEEDFIKNADEEAWRGSRDENVMEGTWKGVKYFDSGLSNNDNKRPWFTEIVNLERRSINTLNRI